MSADARPIGQRGVTMLALIVALYLGAVLPPATVAQQNNNYYFAQSQNRFVPSFENSRNGFFPSALQRQQPPSDSYQEQTLFVNSNNVDRGAGPNDGPTGSRGITPSYYQFTYTRPPPPAATSAPAPEASVRDRQLSYISSRARPFASEDQQQQQQQQQPPTRSSSSYLTAAQQRGERQPQTRSPVVNGGSRNSYSSSRSKPTDSTQLAGIGGRQPSATNAAPSTGNNNNNANNGGSRFGGTSSSSRTTLRPPNRYRSTSTTPTTTTTTTAEAATERATLDTVAVRNRFSGRTPAPNAFRQAFEAKRVIAPSSSSSSSSSSNNAAIAPRGSFINSAKSKLTTTTSATTTSTTTTTTVRAPSLSRFIHQPAKPIIPTINITHNGSAKSAEVIYDYDDYEESKESGSLEGDKRQEIGSDYQRQQPAAIVAKNNSIVLTAPDETVRPVTVTGSESVPASGPTSGDSSKPALEDPDGRLNNISENEYYDSVREAETAPGDSIGVEDHTMILTENFYLPGSGETFEEDDEELDSLQREINGTAEQQNYDEEYVYEDEEAGATTTTTVRPTAKTVPVPPAPAATEELQFSDEDVKDDEAVVASAPALPEPTVQATRESPAEATSTAAPTVPGVESTTATIAENPSSTTERGAISSSETEGATNATTESWVVVHTSRSVSGARFLPFPQVEQDEKKQPEQSDSNRGSNESGDGGEVTTASMSEEADRVTTVAPQEPVIGVTGDALDSVTTEKTPFAGGAHSTESIIDKLDRVQSELSSGLFAGKFSVLKETVTEAVDPKAASSSTVLPAVVIRKFQPNARATTTKKPRPGLTAVTTVKSLTTTTPVEGLVKKIRFETVEDIASLLPADYKLKNAKLKKSETSEAVATTRETLPEETAKPEFNNRFRSANISRSYKSNVPIQELSSLLPKDYKLNRTEEDIKNTNNLKELISKVKVNEKPNPAVELLKKAQKVDISAFLPPGYKAPTAETKPESTTAATTTTSAAKGPVSIEDDVSKFLPPGYKSFKTTKKPTTPAPLATVKDDISKFLPPGYKPTKETAVDSTSERPKIVGGELSKLLPPGYKPPAEEPVNLTPEAIDPSSLLKKIQFKDVSALLPPGFNGSKTEDASSTAGTASSTAGSSNGFKVVFPSRPGVKKPGLPATSARSTTPKPLHPEGPGVPEIHIRKGPPTRATTEFTGWPTPSTTPISIEKLLEQQKQQELLEKLLAASATSSSTSTSTTTTTTTTTTTPRPTEPGLCHSECDLAGTIRIVDGVNWVPELLDHNTAEWKKLAREVETELNEVYSSAKNLSKWYKKVRIDSFNKGSVLVDYFVELTDLSRDVSTLEIRKLFHEALVPVSEPTTTPTTPSAADNEDDYDGGERDDDGGEKVPAEKVQRENLQAPVPRVKEVFQLGKFKVDPVYTDFTVIPKPIVAAGPAVEDDLFLPQWAIAGIVIGLASLLFVILFGVTVLINRQKAAKKKAPTPLTADMLNELNKNHMGGIENFGSEDLYNMEDAWDDRMHDVKPKRFSNSMHGSSGSNIYDSWRSQRHPENYFYDDYGLKGSHYPPNGHHRLHDPAAFMMHEPPPPPVMAMYPPYHHAPPPPPGSHHFSNSSRRYYRDYDPDF
ncbi:mucin-5AC isoform X2 [Anopheles darlingi]|uniref:mucin-5AC isoform X2 n=1 Tax=Anopheles darlingi TaxID=43151 RepID=UPI0021000E3E|nr:mucin-5AC isoform X2 [Anopheles darlingi]